MRFPRVRMSIGHLMIAILIAALALGPMAVALRSPEREWIVAMVAYEVILLPVLVALIVMPLMPPGPTRGRVVAVLCAIPVILLVAVGGTLVVGGNVVAIGAAVARGDVSAIILLFCGLYAIFVAIPKRCPWCGRRRVKLVGTFVPAKRARVTTGCLKCGHCGHWSRKETHGLWLVKAPDEAGL